MATKFADDKEQQQQEQPEVKQETQEEYSERVQRRISQLVGARKAEADRATALEAELAEAKREKAELQKKVSESIPQSAMADQLKSRLDLAKSKYISAYDNGDKEGLVDAQLQIADVTADMKALQQRKVDPPVVETPRQVQREIPPNPLASEWATKNNWFRKDNVMTAAAFVIDNEMANEGYDPNSPEYFSELDRRMKEQFPQRYQTNQRREIVSPSTRGSQVKSKEGPELNDEEKRVARVFGLSEDEYKKQKQRISDSGGVTEIDVRRGR